MIDYYINQISYEKKKVESLGSDNFPRGNCTCVEIDFG